jgi:hypothetical protein
MKTYQSHGCRPPSRKPIFLLIRLKVFSSRLAGPQFPLLHIVAFLRYFETQPPLGMFFLRPTGIVIGSLHAIDPSMSLSPNHFVPAWLESLFLMYALGSLELKLQ